MTTTLLVIACIAVVILTLCLFEEFKRRKDTQNSLDSVSRSWSALAREKEELLVVNNSLHTQIDTLRAGIDAAMHQAKLLNEDKEVIARKLTDSIAEERRLISLLEQSQINFFDLQVKLSKYSRTRDNSTGKFVKA